MRETRSCDRAYEKEKKRGGKKMILLCCGRERYFQCVYRNSEKKTFDSEKNVKKKKRFKW